jgi:hypothetical protein
MAFVEDASPFKVNKSTKVPVFLFAENFNVPVEF